MFVKLPIGAEGKVPTVFVAGVPGGRDASAAAIAACMADMLPGSPVADPGFAPLLADAAARLTPIARGTGGDVVVILSRDTAFGLRRSVWVGSYRYDNRTPGWSTPRPGDPDFLWGERARAVVDDLAAAGWLDGLTGAPAEAALLARASGVFLFAAPGHSAPAQAHAINPEGGTAFAGFQPAGEKRGLVARFEAHVPLEFVSAEGLAAGMVADIGRFLVPLADLDDAQRQDPRFAAYLQAAQDQAAAGRMAEARASLIDGAGMFADEAEAWLADHAIDGPPAEGPVAQAGRVLRPQAMAWLRKLPALTWRRPAIRAA